MLFQISVQIVVQIFEKYFFMDFTNRSKTELCKAFKQALGLLVAEKSIELKAVDAMSGVNTTDIRNFRAKPTPEDVAAIEAAFPGFKDVFLDYLSGGSRWAMSKAEAMRSEVIKAIADSQAAEKYWRDMFIKTNEELKQALWDRSEKNK